MFSCALLTIWTGYHHSRAFDQYRTAVVLMSNLVPRVFSFSNMATVCWKTSRTWGWGCRNEHWGYRRRHWSMRSERCTRLRWLEMLLSTGLFLESSRFPICRCHVGKRQDPGNTVRFWGTYNPGQNSWDTNAIASQIEASSLPPSPSVQCWRYAFKL